MGNIINTLFQTAFKRVQFCILHIKSKMKSFKTIQQILGKRLTSRMYKYMPFNFGAGIDLMLPHTEQYLSTESSAAFSALSLSISPYK